MASFFNFLGDPDLAALENEIEQIVKVVPDVGNKERTTDTDSSKIMHQVLASVDDYKNTDEQEKKNPFYSKKESDGYNGITSEIKTLLDKLVVQPDRANRYRTYEEMYASVPIIKKMLKVWLSNLIQKNPVSGKSLMLRDADESGMTSYQDELYENKKKAAELFTTETIDYFEIINKLKYRIVPNQQMYGDSFVELVNLSNFNPVKDGDDCFLNESSIQSSPVNPVTSPQKKHSDKYLLESITSRLDKKKDISESDLEFVCERLADLFVDVSDETDIIAEGNAVSLSGKSQRVTLNEHKKSESVDHITTYYEYTMNQFGKMRPNLKVLTEKKEQIDEQIKKRRGRPSKKQNEDNRVFNEATAEFGIEQDIDFSKVLLLIHHPKNILILETGYGTKLGYIEVADKENIQVTNIGQQLSSIVGRVVSVNTLSQSQDEVLAKVVRTIIKRVILNSSNGKAKNNVDAVLNSLSPELLNTIKKLIIETNKQDPKRNIYKKIKARFIPIESMFQFGTQSPDFYPYGSSFIDPLVLQGKLYTLSQLSNIIMKLSRAAPVRKWIIDVGPLQNVRLLMI